MTDPEVKQLEETIQSLQADVRRLQKQLNKRNKRIEEERRRWEKTSPSRENLDYVLGHLPLVLWGINREGQVSQFQGAGVDVLGLSGGNVYGRSIFELFEEAPQFTSAVQRALNGEAFSVRVPVQSHLLDCHFTPQWNAEQDVIGVRGVAFVGDRLENDSATSAPETTTEPEPSSNDPSERSFDLLMDQKGPLQSLLRCLPDYVLSVDPQGTIQFINRPIPPLAMDDVVGMSIYEFVTPERQENVREVMDHVFATGEIADHEIESQDPDGVMRIYNCRLGPFKSSGEVLSVMVIARDVTGLREVEELARKRQAELEHISRVATMGEMAAIVAHYLNNPLAAISNYAHGCIRRLKAGDVDIEQLLEAQQEIVEQCNRSSDYIRQLRSFLRKREVQQSETDLTDVIIDAIRLTDPELRSHDLSVHLEMKEKSPWVYGDALQIEQVLVNLLLNAVDAMTPQETHHPESHTTPDAQPRTILIQVEADSANNIIVSVSDSGRGLTPGFEDHIFEPFFTTREKRLGMGLSVSRSIVESHGGRLEALANEESGATFRFSLPRCLSGPSHD